MHLSRDVEGADPLDFSRDLTMPSQICVLCDTGFRLGQNVFLSPPTVLYFGRRRKPWSGKCHPVFDSGIFYC